MQHSEFTRKSLGAAVAAWMGLFVGPNAILSSTQGQFMVPMAQTFGLSRTLISVVLLISPLGVTLCLPAAGRAIDRWGVRRVLIPGLVAFGLLHILLSAVVTLWQLLAVMALISVTAAMHSSVGYAKVISQWFDHKRGTVLGLAVALGSGLGSALFPQIMQITISGHGWRMGYAVLGAIVIVLGLPVMLWLLREPDGRRGTAVSLTDNQSLPGASRAEALRSRTFWLIFAAILLTMTALLGTVMHAFPMLTERGFSPALATTGVSFIFLGSVVGQLTSGFLVDAWHSPRAALPFFVVALVGVLVLHSATTSASMLGGALLLGTALGAENGLAAYLTSRYFGLRDYGSIFSWTFAAAVLGVAVGLVMMGIAHDLTGSYAPMRAIFSVFVGVSVLCIAQLPPYVYLSEKVRTRD